MERSRIREMVWKRLSEVAFPDSRFHWDFSSFIPDFVGSEECVRRIAELDEYVQSRILFITPDNCLTGLRKKCLEDEKSYVMPTYGIRRGFLLMSRSNVPKGKEDLASTLDGAELYAHPIGLVELQGIGSTCTLLGANTILLSRVTQYKLLQIF